MDLDTLLQHYFGTTDLGGMATHELARAKERLSIDFGVERDPGRRFALWTVMDALGFAPAPADAFEEPALRRAAEDYLTAAWRIDRADGDG